MLPSGRIGTIGRISSKKTKKNVTFSHGRIWSWKDAIRTPQGGESPHQGHEAGVKPDGRELVEWDGPDDPQNPQNWSLLRHWWMIGLVSAVTFNMYVLRRPWEYQFRSIMGPRANGRNATNAARWHQPWRRLQCLWLWNGSRTTARS
jgi:hypothetical protein